MTVKERNNYRTIIVCESDNNTFKPYRNDDNLLIGAFDMWLRDDDKVRVVQCTIDKEQYYKEKNNHNMVCSTIIDDFRQLGYKAKKMGYVYHLSQFYMLQCTTPEPTCF